MARYSRRNGPPRQGRWMDLKYAGSCRGCSKPMPAGVRAFYDPADRLVCCVDLECADQFGLTTQEWMGSPVSGSMVKMLSATRFGRPAVTDADCFAKTRSRGYYGRDAGRCEDAPCCGCCN